TLDRHAWITLSLHDALPIYIDGEADEQDGEHGVEADEGHQLDQHGLAEHGAGPLIGRVGKRATLLKFRRKLVGYRLVLLGEIRLDRKSTRLNSSHSQISYAV